MKHHDFSVHFTIKNQSIDEINRKLDLWLENESNKELLDLSERAEGELKPVLHHCFLSRKQVEERGLDTSVVDSLEELAEDQVCWSQVDSSIGMCRVLMLQNLKRLGGVALFVGEIKEGVQKELNLAREFKLTYIIIP